MAQHDYDINSADSISGLQFRADINAVLSAIKSSNSGITAPAVTAAGMLWFDTSVTPAVLRQRDATNLSWLPVGGEGTIGTSIVAAPTTTIGATGQGDFLVITGNTAITSLGASTNGVRRTLVFTGTPIVTNHNTSLILPGAVDINVVAGTVIEVICIDGALGYWLCVSVQHPNIGFNELAYLDGLEGTLANIEPISGAVFLGSGTTLQRPVLLSTARAMWYNTDLSKFEGWNGTQWIGVGGGATGGGADTVFVETSYTVTQNYTITAGKSALTVGDALGNVYIQDGVNITIPDASLWAIQGV